MKLFFGNLTWPLSITELAFIVSNDAADADFLKTTDGKTNI
jgi:hypothetical protein